MAATFSIFKAKVSHHLSVDVRLKKNGNKQFFKLNSRYDVKKIAGSDSKCSSTDLLTVGYFLLYNNKINARVLIGQSAMLYCAGKPMEKLRVF